MNKYDDKYEDAGTVGFVVFAVIALLGAIIYRWDVMGPFLGIVAVVIGLSMFLIAFIEVLGRVSLDLWYKWRDR